MPITAFNPPKKLEGLHLEEIRIDFETNFENNLIDEKDIKMFKSLMNNKSSCVYSETYNSIAKYIDDDAYESGHDFIYYSSIHLDNYEIFFKVIGEYVFNRQFRKLTKLDIIVKVNSIKKIKKNRKLKGD